METLVYIFGFVIGVLGTSFFLYYHKTKKLLKKQHELIMELMFILLSERAKVLGKEEGKTEEKTDKKEAKKKVNKDKE